MKLLARGFVEARPTPNAVASFLAEQVSDVPVPAPPHASRAVGAGRPMLGSVGVQCLDVLTSVLHPSATPDKLTQDELKMMARALGTLNRAAAHQKANVLRDRTQALLDACKKAGAEACGKQSIAPLVAQVRTLEEELRKCTQIDVREPSTGEARTISLRPSKAAHGVPSRRAQAAAPAPESGGSARTSGSTRPNWIA